MKKITFQQLSEEGILHIGNAIEIMAETEQLDAHKNAVTLRLGAATARQLSPTGSTTEYKEINTDTPETDSDREEAQPNEEL